jgi:hypothetical protein
MLDVVEKAFAPELLSVSSRAAGFVDFAWTVYRIGGAVPVGILGQQFAKAEDMVSVLSKAGVLRYAMGGFINRDQKKLSLSVTLSEDLARQLPDGVRRKDFENILYRSFGDRMIPFSRTDLTEPLAIMLTSIIFYATPERPAFSNTIVRRTAKVSMKDHMHCQNMLDYYLSRFLGLVSYETGSLINLSVRSRQRVRANPKIWELYVKPYQAKEEKEHDSPPEFQLPPVQPTTKASEQERKLKGYFPWMKL